MSKPTESYLEELFEDFDSEIQDDSSLIPQPFFQHHQKKITITIQDIPVEILIDLTVKFLDIHDIRSMMSVCKNWYLISRGDEIWRGLFLIFLENENQGKYQEHQDSTPQQNQNNDGFVIVNSPQHLAKLLSVERQRVELLEMNRNIDDYLLPTFTSTSSTTTPPTKSIESSPQSTFTTSSFPTERNAEWEYHFAIPSSFIHPINSTKIPHQRSIHCCLMQDYSHLPQGKWYFRYKQLHSEIFCANSWKSLAESWKWLRSVLRDQLYLIWKRSSPTTESNSSPTKLVPSSTITRAVEKLTTVNWIRFYETLKEEMALQADALTRDLLAFYSTTPSLDPLSIVLHTSKICQIFISWCDELDTLLIPLNCRISNDQETTDACCPSERFKRNRNGRFIGTENHNQDEDHDQDHDDDLDNPETQQTPHIDNLCSIILRSRCLLQWEVSNIFKDSLQRLCSDLEEQTITTNQPTQSSHILSAVMGVYELLQSLDVPDDVCFSYFHFDQQMNQHLSISFETQKFFRSCYLDFFRSQHVLLPHIRECDRMKRDENDSIQQPSNNHNHHNHTATVSEIHERKRSFYSNDK